MSEFQEPVQVQNIQAEEGQIKKTDEVDPKFKKDERQEAGGRGRPKEPPKPDPTDD